VAGSRIYPSAAAMCPAEAVVLRARLTRSMSAAFRCGGRIRSESASCGQRVKE
jgi:hypothetical protein